MWFITCILKPSIIWWQLTISKIRDNEKFHEVFRPKTDKITNTLAKQCLRLTFIQWQTALKNFDQSKKMGPKGVSVFHNEDLRGVKLKL